MFRKRTYAGRQGGGFAKRRKFSGRRRFRRRRTGSLARTRGISWTSQSGGSRGIAYKGRKTSSRAWHRILWRNTVAKSHFRSNAAQSSIVTTPALATVMITNQRQALNATGAFWTAAGGTVPLDVGATVPIFNGDIILRGGKVGISFYNTSATVPLYIQLFLVRDVPRDVLANIPLNPAVGWDHTHVPEFHTDIAKYIITQKQFTIKPEEACQTEVRLKPMKIDQQDWVVDQQQLTWLIAITDYDGVAATPVRITHYHNVSFSGDVDAP